jgi:UDP-glucose 4-epimerase
VIFGDGSHTRDFLYVKDCAQALVQIAECDALVGDLVNLGYGEEIRVDALANLVLTAVGRTDLQPIHEPERPGDVPRLWVDPTKIRRITQWRPPTATATGLAATVEYYRALHAANPDCLAQMQTRNWEVKR